MGLEHGLAFNANLSLAHHKDPETGDVTGILIVRGEQPGCEYKIPYVFDKFEERIKCLAVNIDGRWQTIIRAAVALTELVWEEATESMTKKIRKDVEEQLAPPKGEEPLPQ